MRAHKANGLPAGNVRRATRSADRRRRVAPISTTSCRSVSSLSMSPGGDPRAQDPRGAGSRADIAETDLAQRSRRRISRRDRGDGSRAEIAEVAEGAGNAASGGTPPQAGGECLHSQHLRSSRSQRPPRETCVSDLCAVPRCQSATRPGAYRAGACGGARTAVRG